MALDSKDITFLRNLGGTLMKLAEMDNVERDITALEAKRQDAVKAKEEADAAAAQAQAEHAATVAALKEDAEAHTTQVMAQHANQVDAAQRELKAVTDQLEEQRTALAAERSQHEHLLADLKQERADLQAVVDKLKEYKEKATEAVFKL